VLCAATAYAIRSGNFERVEGYTFDEYVEDFNKQYENDADRAQHKSQFYAKLQRIISHNQNLQRSWKMGVNRFTDLSKEEMKAYYGNSIEMSLARKSAMPVAELPKMDKLPDSIDWREKNVVTPVRDQGGCGSCWAFAASETLESHLALATGKLKSLSPQHFVSCVQNPQHCGGTGGCGGATPELAYEQVAVKGVALEADFPYRARNTPCRGGFNPAAKITGYVKLAENNYTALITALATVGPISVSVDASDFSEYSSGIFTSCQYRDITINHAVVAVGYGRDAASGKDYWLIRNSWSASWGESGYLRIERHADGSMKYCGPDTRPQDGTGCDGGPPVITVCGECGLWYDNVYPVGVTG